MQQHLTDVHKDFIRRTMQGGAEQLIADLERDAARGVDIEKFIAGMYLAFQMSAPLPPKPDEPTETDETQEDKP